MFEGRGKDTEEMKFLIFVFMLLPSVVFPQKAFKTGNDLKAECFSANAAIELACKGFIVGVTDARGDVICLPANVSVQQITDVVKKYLDDNPTVLHYSAHSIIRRVLSSTFPCQK